MLFDMKTNINTPVKPIVNKRARMILSGPRGRRLCLEALQAGTPDLSFFRYRVPGRAVDFGTPRLMDTSFIATVTDMFLGEWAETTDQWLALRPFARSTESARYWMKPELADQWMAARSFARELMPIARALAGAPGNAWWFEPMGTQTQHYLEPTEGGKMVPPEYGYQVVELARWRESVRQAEVNPLREGERRLVICEGNWVSTPVRYLGLTTTRLLGDGYGVSAGCPRGMLVDAESVAEDARLWPVCPRDGARIYEIAERKDWAALVTRYPLDVTTSRDYEWSTATGLTSRWLIPDWEAVARDFDAVHLQAAAYLSGAGTVLDIPGGRTIMAGFDPDSTFWLTDSVVPAGEPLRWSAPDDEVWEDEGWASEDEDEEEAGSGW